MLDIEVVVAALENGIDILPVADLKKRLRISHNRLDDVLESCIIEAADKLHGPDGELRRTLFPTVYKRYLSRFPDLKDDRSRVVAVGRGAIPLPYPNLIEVLSVTIEDGSSPDNEADRSSYVVRIGTLVGEVELRPGRSWPEYTPGPRAISITYRAGFTTYPPKLKRMVAILAAHYFINNSATIQEPRVLMLNRQTEFGMSDLRRSLQVPLDHSDWGEDV